MLKIFTEASHSKGFGHLARMSCILEHAKAQGQEAQLHLDSAGEEVALFGGEAIRVDDWLTREQELALVSAADIAVIDSYNVSINRIQALSKKVKRLVVIDDNKRLDYMNLTVLNPNYFSEYLQYPKDKGNDYRTGKDYTLLRTAFWPERQRSAKKKAEEILVTFGGTDVLDMTPEAIGMIQSIAPAARMHVVATDSFRNLSSIQRMIGPRDNLILNADAAQMASLMRQVDFAIAAAGGTSNELIKTQCPAILIPVADNQRLNARILSENGLALSADNVTPALVSRMMEEGVRHNMIRKMKEKESQKSGAEYILSLCRE